MALEPVTRQSVPEQVFGQIAADVLSGELQPGEALPSERRLAELFGVSRPAVREALKQLSASGLVEVRQGGVTTVRDFRRHASLDLLPQLLFRDGRLDPAVAHSLLEARLRNGPKVAELAAERHGHELIEALDKSLQVLENENDLIEWQRQTLNFWDYVVDGAGSIVFRLMYNAFRAAYEPALPMLTASISTELKRPDDYRALADAISAGDAAKAKKAAQDLIERANATLATAFDKAGSRQ
ncbi:MAG TPA: FadR/GntR family transcriptional regulator [Mycobacterium sp.]|nr:FadR/GntR family transcriptional regulator [Mycobacterium sp.]